MVSVASFYEPSGRKETPGWLMVLLGGVGSAVILGVVYAYLIDSIFAHLLITLEQRKQLPAEWGSERGLRI